MTDADDARLLQRLQAKAFDYFRHETDPRTGLVADKTAPDWPASIAAMGLALASYPVAVERGLMPHAEALQRVLATLRFLRDSPQGPEPDATGHRGFYYHFLDMRTGRRAWQCELSTVDSAFLFAGMLAAAAYFTADTADERALRALAHALYARADWTWVQAADGTLGHGWHPETGFLPYRWQGYDEGLLMYMLALGAPDHPLPPASYAAWASTYAWRREYDIDYLDCAPLFAHQLSHAWVDFRGIRDDAMRGKGSDYFENSRRATQVQQRYAIDNPLRFRGYGRHGWGITASDGPGPMVRTIDGIERRFYDYIGRGVPGGIDDGTLSPWAVVASLPFAPDLVLPTLHHYVHALGLHDRHRYGFRASFNQTFTDGSIGGGWESPYCFGINLGPIVLMVENHLTGLPWQWMRTCEPLVAGLQRAGFAGGWLGGDAGALTG
jgi:hypothetical protein